AHRHRRALLFAFVGPRFPPRRHVHHDLGYGRAARRASAPLPRCHRRGHGRRHAPAQGSREGQFRQLSRHGKV
ncbi:hypothetical protein BN1708_020651, partial [Verticillium longisporum]